MTPERRAKRLVSDLRKLYHLWEYRPNSCTFESGICFALFIFRNSDNAYDTYTDVGNMLARCQNGWTTGSPECASSDNWDDGIRATIILLLAEWIETDFLPFCSEQ